MKFATELLASPIELSEDYPNVFVVEKTEYLQFFVRQMMAMETGDQDSDFYRGIQQVDFEKEIDLLLDPFTISVNSRRILNGLTKYLVEMANGDYYFSRTSALLRDIKSYLNELSRESVFSIDYDDQTLFLGLVKAFNLKIEDDAEELIVNILNYLQAAQTFCRKSVFVFLNLRQLLTEDQLLSLYKFSAYRKICLFLLESSDTKENLHPFENLVILDKDLCEIRSPK